jgi:hypothetical protein
MLKKKVVVCRHVSWLLWSSQYVYFTFFNCPLMLILGLNFLC